MARTPPLGRVTDSLQTGQMSSVTVAVGISGCCLSLWVSRQREQNVSPQWRVFGSVRVERQMGHSRREADTESWGGGSEVDTSLSMPAPATISVVAIEGELH